MAGIPEYTDNTIASQIGVVRVEPVNALTAGLLDVGASLQGIGKQAAARYVAQATADATQAGQAAGVMRDANGQLTVTLRDNSSEANRAWNAGAVQGYSAEFSNDARAAAADMRTKFANDPAGFQAAWDGHATGTLQQVAPGLRPDAQVMLSAFGAAEYRGLVNDKSNLDRENSKNAVELQLNSLGNDLGALARGGGVDTPAYRLALNHYSAVLDGQVAAGFLSPESAVILKNHQADDGVAQHFASLAVDAYTKAGGGIAGARVADTMLQSIMTDPTLNIDEARREAIANNARQRINELSSLSQVDSKALRDEAQPLIDRMTAGFQVDPGQLLNYAARAGAAGDAAFAAELQGLARRSGDIQAFTRQSLPDMMKGAQSAAEAAKIEGQTNISLSDALIAQESAGVPTVVSPKGAVGLMQVMPATAREVAKSLGDSRVAAMNDDQITEFLKDPVNNRRYGEAYLTQMLHRYGGSAPLALAAYNAGPGAVDSWIAANGDPRTGAITDAAWIAAIPIAETKAYVPGVLARLGVALPSSQAAQRAVDYQNAVEAKTKALQADPFAYGIDAYKNTLGATAAIDWSSPDGLAAQLQSRQRSAAYIEGYDKVQTVPLTVPEIDRLAGALSSMNANQKSILLASLADGLGPTYLPRVMAQLTKKGDEAQLFADAAGIAQSAPDIARQVLAGADVRKAEPKIVPTDDTKVMQDYLGNSLRAMPEALRSATERARDLYAFDANQKGDLSGKLDTARLTNALEAATGGIVEHNGAKIIAPQRGMDQSQFDDLLAGLNDGDLGVNPPVTQDGRPVTAAMIRDYGLLQSIGDGQYLVTISDDAGHQLYTAAGQPFTLDLSKTPIRAHAPLAAPLATRGYRPDQPAPNRFTTAP